MKTKTIFLIAFTALLTIFLMMNTDAVEFDFLFFKSDVSKLAVVGVSTLLGFGLGYWAAKPKTIIESYDLKTDDTAPKDHLSPEDRDYIS